MDIATVAAVIIGAGAVVAAVHQIWTRVVRPSLRGLRKANKMIDDVETVPELHTKMDDVLATLGRLEPLILAMDHEMHPNSGQSMKDQITRIDRGLSEHTSDTIRHN